MERTYLCIDLKSFYASVECVDRKLDPLTTNLVVADPSRGQGAICLAITPHMKTLGIRNRCRIFEIPKDVIYITALPRMKKYMEMSVEIYKIYLKYISADDIHVYSIDECFLDVTNYLHSYNLNAIQLGKKIALDVLKTTGITATVGIGTNLFLAKIALDITAKHSPDYIGVLDEEIFKKTLWDHQPITDFWNISTGTAHRLAKYGAFTLREVTEIDEKKLYQEFGINAELLIDHAWGRETCTMEDIHKYKSKSNSLSNSQILFDDYVYKDALLAFKEMVDLNCLELVEKNLVTNQIFISVGYSKDEIKPTGGSMKLDGYTSSEKKLMEYFLTLFKKTTDQNHLIRRLSLGFGNVKDESFATFDLFTDIEAENKEKRMQEALIAIKHKYGKNAILKGMNYEEKATTLKRNKLIGGHNSGEDE